MRAPGNSIDCGNPINWSCPLNRGLIGDYTYIPGLYDTAWEKKVRLSSTVISNLYDLTQLSGGRVHYDASGLNNGVHAMTAGGGAAGTYFGISAGSANSPPRRPGGFGSALKFTSALTDGFYLGGAGLTNASRYLFQRADKFSILLWFRLDSISGVDQSLFSNGWDGATLPGWCFDVTNTGQNIRFRAMSGNGAASGRNVQGTTTLPANTWSFIGVTWDGTNTAAGIQLYYNAVAETKTTNLDTDPGEFTNYWPMLGSLISATGNTPTAGIDAVRVFNRCLDPNEIVEQYRESRAGSPQLYNRIRNSAWFAFPTVAISPAAGGDSLSVAVGDVSASALFTSVTDTPTVVITDASGGAVGIIVGVAVNDSPTWVITDASAITARLALVDTLTAVVTEGASAVLNSFGVSDTPTTRLTETSLVAVSISTTDAPAAAITDANAIKALLAVVDTPTVVVSDSSASLLFLNPADAPTLVATEGTTGILVRLPSLDGLAVRLDEAGPITPVLVALALSDNPTLTIGDASQFVVVVGVTDTPTVVISDSSALLVPRAVNDSPAASVGDASALLVALPAQDAFAIQVGELIATRVALAVADSPSAAINDASDLLAIFGVVDTPAAAITDASAIKAALTVADNPAVAIGDTSAVLVMLTAADSLAVSIATTVALVLTSTGTDTLTGDIMARPALAGQVTARPALVGNLSARPALTGKITARPL